MLRVAVVIPQAVVVGLVVYNLLTALAGWKNGPPAKIGPRSRRFVVAVPAHDEEAVIATVVGDLLAADYPTDLVEVWVLADRCADQTAALARDAGAGVIERSNGPDGKGALLAWFLGIRSLASDEALVVIDADNRVPANFFVRVADELDDGRHAIQVYLDAATPDGSWVATASAMTYWAGNRMVQLARSNLGWPVDLGGTGMILDQTALEAVGGFGGSLAEDNEMAVKLALAGINVSWLHDVRVVDEKPGEIGVAVRQRARWKAGRRAVRRQYLSRLWVAGIRRRRWGLIDQGLRLVQPSRTMMAVVTGLFFIASLLQSGWLFPWWMWATLAGLQLVAPAFFLRRDGRPWSMVARYPMLAGLALLWLPVMVASRRIEGWYHTPHRGAR